MVMAVKLMLVDGSTGGGGETKFVLGNTYTREQRGTWSTNTLPASQLIRNIEMCSQQCARNRNSQRTRVPLLNGTVAYNVNKLKGNFIHFPSLPASLSLSPI